MSDLNINYRGRNINKRVKSIIRKVGSNMVKKFKELLQKQKKALVTGGIAFVAIIVIALIFIAQQNKIDLADIYKVEVNGLDTQGTASYQIDKDRLSTTLLSKNVDFFSANMFIETIKCDLDKKENLKNGDKITAKITYDQTLAKQLNVTFRNIEKVINVSGLEKGTEVDVFKDIQVSFTGTSPDGSVSISNKSSDPFVSEVTFFPPEGTVANGDRITVNAIYDDQEAIAQKVIVKQDNKDYTVSGLPEYLMKSTQLSQDITDQINTLTEKTINTYVNQSAAFFINHIPNRMTSTMYSLGDTYSCKNIVNQQAYLITAKENSSTAYTPFKHSQYWVISAVDIYANNKKESTTYISTKVTDVIINNKKIDASSASSTRQDSLEKAKQYVEELNSAYNIESVVLK